MKAFLIFHVADEPDLDRWQSGVFYADDTPKSSMAPVRAEALAARAGSIPAAARPRPPHGRAVAERRAHASG